MKSRIWGKSIGGILLTALVICCLVTPAITFAADWPQFHNDVSHTGYSTSTAPNTNSLAWVSADVGAIPSSSPVVANGKVFVNGGDQIRCLDESNGVLLWSAAIVGGNQYGSWASPAYDDGRVYISGTEIYCFDENTADGGSPLWSYPMGSNAVNGGPCVADGKVFAGDWDGHKYYCIDAVNSTSGNVIKLWDFAVTGYAQGTPAYYDDGADGRVYLTSWQYVGGHVYCLNATTGALIWHGTTTIDTCGSPTVADGRVWVTTYNFSNWGQLLAFDVNDVDSDGAGDLVWGPVQIERSDSTPAYHDGKIYVCGGCVGYSNEGERTYCWDVATQTMDWQTPITGPNIGDWTCSPAVADGKVFVGKPESASGMFFDYTDTYALDAATGNVVWTYDNGGASSAVANGHVYTIGEGKVWAFGEEMTYPDWDVNEDGAINIADVSIIGGYWGETGAPGWIRADVNDDGVVNIADVSIIGGHWGE